MIPFKINILMQKEMNRLQYLRKIWDKVSQIFYLSCEGLYRFSQRRRGRFWIAQTLLGYIQMPYFDMICPNNFPSEVPKLRGLQKFSGLFSYMGRVFSAKMHSPNIY